MILALYHVVKKNKRNVIIHAKDQVVADQLKDIHEAYIPGE